MNETEGVLEIHESPFTVQSADSRERDMHVCITRARIYLDATVREQSRHFLADVQLCEIGESDD